MYSHTVLQYLNTIHHSFFSYRYMKIISFKHRDKQRALSGKTFMVHIMYRLLLYIGSNSAVQVILFIRFSESWELQNYPGYFHHIEPLYLQRL